MSEDQIRLIAKIQHFYDLLCKTKEDYIKDAITFPTNNTVERDCVLREYEDLLDTYGAMFNSILYRGDEKGCL